MTAVAEAPPQPLAPPTLYPHQKDAIYAALRAFNQAQTTPSTGFYIVHDPGMGKSLTAILLARLLKVERILVVTTKAGLGVWRGELARWWPDAPYVHIVNYDRLLAPTYLKHAVFEGGGVDLLILDEAQYAKNPSSKRSRAVRKLAQAARYKLLLSGTPAHTPLDYHAQYRLIAPKEWPWSLTPSAYKALVCKLEGPYGNWVKGFQPQAVKQVERAMAPLTHKANKDELHLPEPIETVVPITLSAAEQRAYAEMEKRLLVELPPEAMADAPIVLTKILRLQQITSGFLKDTAGVEHPVGTSKLDACMELLEERREQKVVVAYRFKWERDALLSRIAGAFGEGKMPWVYYIDGEVSDAGRTKLIKAFQELPGPKILLLQYQAGGTAITLTAADAMIFLSMTPSVIEWEQIKARIHRIGTTTHVQYLYLLAERSVDETLFEGLKEKADLVRLTSLLRRRLHG